MVQEIIEPLRRLKDTLASQNILPGLQLIGGLGGLTNIGGIYGLLSTLLGTVSSLLGSLLNAARKFEISPLGVGSGTNTSYSSWRRRKHCQ